MNKDMAMAVLGGMIIMHALGMVVEIFSHNSEIAYMAQTIAWFAASVGIIALMGMFKK